MDNENMVHRIAEILGVDPKIRQDDFHSSRPGHDLRYALDGTKLRDYGFSPATTFEEALRTTVLSTKESLTKPLADKSLTEGQKPPK